MRVLGLDYGRRRIGLALSDEGGELASPLSTHVRSRSEFKDLVALAGLFKQHEVERFVVGLPLHMDGSAGEMATEAEAFGRKLEAKTGRPIEFFDERLTSAEAERVLLEANLTRERRRELRDSLSAVLILQGYLDQRNRSS